METGKPIFLILLVLCFMSSDILQSTAIAKRHHGGHGIEYLLAAGILAKLLSKKHGHHHHHHGHHEHHGHHHHGRHAEAGSMPVIPMALPPPPPPPMVHPHQGVQHYHHPSQPHPVYHPEHYPGSATSTTFSASVEPLFNYYTAQPSNMHMMFGVPSTNIQYYQEPPRIPYPSSTSPPAYSASEQAQSAPASQ